MSKEGKLQYNREYYHKNKERLNKKRAERRLDNLDEERSAARARYLKYVSEHKEERDAYNRAYKEAHPEQTLLHRAKASAKKRGRDFNLTEEDITIPTHCPYLGIALTFTGKYDQSTASIDRIDSSKGYVKGNVQIISYLANTMKSNATLDQLLLFAENVIKKHSTR